LVLYHVFNGGVELAVAHTTFTSDWGIKLLQGKVPALSGRLEQKKRFLPNLSEIDGVWKGTQRAEGDVKQRVQFVTRDNSSRGASV
jgi:hypothetical protein